jgi:serine/threonine-protein kinase
MNASLLSEAVNLIDEAAQLPPPARDAFFTQRCREHAELLALVRQIEAAPSDSRAPILGDSLEAVAPELFPDDDAPDPLLGKLVGEYLIEARIGQGGMGRVYSALYTRHHVRVALKVLQGAPHSQTQSRLQREVELLERCKHPAIVRARSSGQLPDGRTYFTMDLVEGQPITAFCAAASPTLAERLRLLIAACEAVQAAHAVGVIHRDLKPSNILIADGSPAAAPSVRLLDFGIAEASGDNYLGVRNYIAVAYAAPEHSEATTPQTDVYSLGILLAELVLGCLPFHIADRNPSAARRDILAQGLQPLRVFADPKVQPWLSKMTRLRWRELEAIYFRAAAPLPDHRYATVKEFADDIERFLTHRPVQALKLSRNRRAFYETRRLVSRNRLATAAAACILLLLAGAITSYTWTLRQSRNAARQAAARATAHAEKMQQLSAGLFLDGDGPLNASLTAEGLLDRGMQSAKALDSEPEEQAEFLLTLGRSYQGLGRYPKAEAALSQSLAILTHLHGPESPQAAEVISQQADLRSAQGKPREALALAQRALAIQQRTLPPGDKVILESQTTIAELWTELGDYQKPVPLLEEVIRQETGKPALLNDLSNALNNLSIVENYLGHTQRSLELQEQTMAIDRKIEGPRHADIGMHLITLSSGHTQLGQYALAEAEAREAVSILKEKLPPGHHDTAAAESRLGIVLMDESRWPEAQASLEEALRTFTAEPERSRSEAMALWALGAAYEGEGKLPQALETYQRALAEYKHLYPAANTFWTSPLRGIASVALKQGKPAERSARQAYEICRSQLSPSDPKTIQSELLLGRALAAQHNYREADPLLQETLRLANAGGQATADLRPQAAQALLDLKAAVAHQRSGGKVDFTMKTP